MKRLLSLVLVLASTFNLCAFLALSMARSRQTARRSTGGKASRKHLVSQKSKATSLETKSAKKSRLPLPSPADWELGELTPLPSRAPSLDIQGIANEDHGHDDVRFIIISLY